MIKSAIAFVAAAPLMAAPALAGPYVNVKATQVSLAATTLVQLLISMWYEAQSVKTLLLYQALSSSPDGGEVDTVPSGKAGLGLALSDSLGAHGEVSFQGSGSASVDRGYGTKLGLKYSF